MQATPRFIYCCLWDKSILLLHGFYCAISVYLLNSSDTHSLSVIFIGKPKADFLGGFLGNAHPISKTLNVKTLRVGKRQAHALLVTYIFTESRRLTSVRLPRKAHPISKTLNVKTLRIGKRQAHNLLVTS